MPPRTRKTPDLPEPRRKPATTPESREHQMISLAVDAAERQMREGTASAQVITHYLKLGSSRESLEQERLRHENELMKAKTDQIAASEGIGKMYEMAMRAFAGYKGTDLPEGIFEDED